MADLPLTAFDVAVLLIVGISALLALVRGATREALTMAAWIGALVVAYYGFGYVRELAQKTIEVRWIADIVALVVVFVDAPDRLQDGRRGALGSCLRMAASAWPTGWSAWRSAWCVVRRSCARSTWASAILIEPDEQPSWMTRAALLPYVQEGAGMLQDLLPADAEEAGREAVREARREVERELASP